MESVEAHIKQMEDIYGQQVDDILSAMPLKYFSPSFPRATREEDMKMGFDMNVKVNGCHIAVRIRDGEYFHFKDLTIRSHRKKFTELDKVEIGLGHRYLYCWKSVNNPSKIQHWMFIDLDAFRKSAINQPSTKFKSNRDGTYFHCYDITTLKMQDCILDKNF